MAVGGRVLLFGCTSSTFNARNKLCINACARTNLLKGVEANVIGWNRQLSSRSKPPTKDLYAILKVSPFATQSQIKDSYYNLSMKYHPDQNQGRSDTEILFKELTDAYSILGKPSSRRNYDKGLLRDYPIPHHVKEMKHKRAASFSKTAKKSTRIYDFEEFDRRHYGDLVKERRSFEQRRRKAEQEHQIFKRVTHSSSHIYVVPALLMAILWYTGFRRNQYNR